MRKTFILCLMILTFKYAGHASFEIQESGAANAAMANAVSSVVRDATCLYHNPGVLGLITDKEIGLTQFFPYSWGLLVYDSLVFVQPFQKETLGFSISYLGTLKDTDYRSQLDYNEVLLSGGYGTTLPFLPRFSAGAVLKYLSTYSSDVKSAGFGLDLGFLYRPGSVNLALVVKDVSLGSINYSTGARETLNPLVRFGLSTSAIKNLVPSLDVSVKLKGSVAPFQAGLGIQFSYQWVAVRSGFSYAGSDSLALSAGLGFRAPFLKGIFFDYAFVYHTGLNYSNMFSAGIKF